MEGEIFFKDFFLPGIEPAFDSFSILFFSTSFVRSYKKQENFSVCNFNSRKFSTTAANELIYLAAIKTSLFGS